jgi:hypothetical protein
VIDQLAKRYIGICHLFDDGSWQNESRVVFSFEKSVLVYLEDVSAMQCLNILADLVLMPDPQFPHSRTLLAGIIRL